MHVYSEVHPMELHGNPSRMCNGLKSYYPLTSLKSVIRKWSLAWVAKFLPTAWIFKIHPILPGWSNLLCTLEKNVQDHSPCVAETCSSALRRSGVIKRLRKKCGRGESSAWHVTSVFLASGRIILKKEKKPKKYFASFVIGPSRVHRSTERAEVTLSSVQAPRGGGNQTRTTVWWTMFSHHGTNPDLT